MLQLIAWRRGLFFDHVAFLVFYYTDLSRAIDSSVKDKINDLTGNDDYEFGDLR